jgi:tetratricopeptide (TPR) repeat protein
MGHAEYRVATLVEHFLLRPEGQDFLFCHALIRDGAYESLLKSRRRQLHARAAEWFGEDDPVLAAEHYERAEHPQAARACLAASVLESSRCHFSAALAFAERGLKIAKSSEDCFELSCMRAMVLNEMGQANAAADAWRVALESSQGHTERCRALIGLAQALRIVDRSEDGFAALADAEALAREAQLTLELSRVHHLRGNYFFGQGRASECLQEHENALLRAREVACVEAEANALSGLGDAHYVSGRMRSASEQFQACVDLARRAGLGRIEVANRHMVGWSMHYLGGLRAALEVGLESIDMATRVSHLRVELIARLLVSYVGGCLIGDLDCGQAHLEASLKLCRQLGAKRFEAQNLTYRALLSLRAGERRVAEREARVALCFSREHGMKFFGAVSLGLLARLSGDATERIQLNGEAVARLKEGAISHNHFEFYVQAIESALERGAWDESERYCQALEGYTASERLPWSDFVIERGRRLVEAGRGERGQELLLALEHLRGLALRHEYRVMVPALEEAIASAGGPSAIAQAQPPERRAI